MMTIDDVDDSSVKTSKEKITDMLEKRNRERLINLDSKHELSKQNAAADEDHEYFIQIFRDHTKQIDVGINELCAGDTQLLTQINKLIGDIQHLQNYLTASTLFLSSFTIKSSQTTINELKTKLEAVKSKLVIKKKFGFRMKATEPTPPASASTAVPANVTIQPQPNKIVVASAATSHINWTVQNRCAEDILLDNAAVDNQDITISNLNNCIVRIVGHPGSLQLSHLTNCIVLSGPVCRSVFADNCTQLKLSFGCQQLRLHSSTQCDLYMHVTSRAIIEDCNNIRVTPDIYRYDSIDTDFTAAGLDVSKNNWNNVADFNWLSTNVHSPNWTELNGCDRIVDWQQFISIFRNDFKISI